MKVRRNVAKPFPFALYFTTAQCCNLISRSDLNCSLILKAFSKNPIIIRQARASLLTCIKNKDSQHLIKI